MDTGGLEAILASQDSRRFTSNRRRGFSTDIISLIFIGARHGEVERRIDLAFRGQQGDIRPSIENRPNTLACAPRRAPVTSGLQGRGIPCGPPPIDGPMTVAKSSGRQQTPTASSGRESAFPHPVAAAGPVARTTVASNPIGGVLPPRAGNTRVGPCSPPCSPWTDFESRLLWSVVAAIEPDQWS
jgi:hypothetical protein